MRFRFLGTGTSSGIPSIGCECPCCTSTDPRDTRLRCSGLLRFVDPGGQERAVLIDAGPDLRQQALAAGMDRLDAVLLTHHHVDHIWGLDEVRRFNVLMDGAMIDVYGDAHTLGSVRRVYQHIFEPHLNVQKSFVASLIAHEVEPSGAFDLFGLRVTPLALMHGRLEILGYRIEAADPAVASPLLPLAYCTDVSGIPTPTWAQLEGLSTLVLDALRHRHHPTHQTLGRAVEVAEQVGACRTFFIHMSHDLVHEETVKLLPPTVALAHDGLELPGDS